MPRPSINITMRIEKQSCFVDILHCSYIFMALVVADLEHQ